MCYTYIFFRVDKYTIVLVNVKHFKALCGFYSVQNKVLLLSPEPPRSRWSVATRARQIHQRAGSLQGNVHFGESTNRRRHVPQASEQTTTEPEVDTSYPSGDLGNRSAEPLADVVLALAVGQCNGDPDGGISWG